MTRKNRHTDDTDLSQLFNEEYIIQVLFHAARIIRTWLWLFDLRKVAEVVSELMNIVKGLKHTVHKTGIALKVRDQFYFYFLNSTRNTCLDSWVRHLSSFRSPPSSTFSARRHLRSTLFACVVEDSRPTEVSLILNHMSSCWRFPATRRRLWTLSTLPRDLKKSPSRWLLPVTLLTPAEIQTTRLRCQRSHHIRNSSKRCWSDLSSDYVLSAPSES